MHWSSGESFSSPMLEMTADEPLHAVFSIALLVACLAVARSPSSAIVLVSELGAHGPATTTILSVIILIDVVVVLFTSLRGECDQPTAGDSAADAMGCARDVQFAAAPLGRHWHRLGISAPWLHSSHLIRHRHRRQGGRGFGSAAARARAARAPAPTRAAAAAAAAGVYRTRQNPDGPSYDGSFGHRRV